jgi:hypothetical protein
MKSIKQIFDEWPKNLLRPVLISVLTAGALFGLAALFKPALHWLFTPPKNNRYPLVCFFEPYNNAGEAKQYYVDLYIVNITADDVSREKLKENIPESSERNLSPDLDLTMDDKYSGNIESATVPEDFNKGKGDIEVKHDQRAATVTIRSIKQRTFMKVTFLITNVSRVRSKTVISRDAQAAWVPFDFETLQDRCYQAR